MLTTIIYIVIGFLVFGVSFGYLTRAIARKKGYHHGFAWGFWLGPIGLLIFALKPGYHRHGLSYYSDSDHDLPNKKSFEPSVAETEVKAEEASEDETIPILETLVRLHEQGILTDEEFQQKKADLLSKL